MARFLRITLAVLLALGTGFGALFLWAHWHLHLAPFRGDRFTPDHWRQVWDCSGLSNADCAMHRAACSRGSMVSDLLAHHLHPGLSRSAVQTLLGPPDWQDDIATRQGRHADCDHYDLGHCSGFGVDTAALFVCHDAANRLVLAGHREN